MLISQPGAAFFMLCRNPHLVQSYILLLIILLLLQEKGRLFICSQTLIQITCFLVWRRHQTTWSWWTTSKLINVCMSCVWHENGFKRWTRIPPPPPPSSHVDSNECQEYVSFLSAPQTILSDDDDGDDDGGDKLSISHQLKVSVEVSSQLLLNG